MATPVYELPNQGIYCYKTCAHTVKVATPQPGTLSTTNTCSECNASTQLWMCMTCQKVLCGRRMKSHAVAHSKQTGHPLVCSLTMTDLHVWCYGCEAYVSANPRVDEFRLAVMQRWLDMAAK